MNVIHRPYVYTVQRAKGKRRDKVRAAFIRQHGLRPGDKIKMVDFYLYCRLCAKVG